jgi:hypothetical protein
MGERPGVRLMGWISSGLPEREPVAGGIEDTEMRLPREELLEAAEAGVIVRGTEVLTYCLIRSLANALVWEVWAVWVTGLSCSSEAECMDGAVEELMVKGWRGSDGDRA